MEQKEAVRYVRSMLGDQIELPKGVDIPVNIKCANAFIPRLIGAAALIATCMYITPAIPAFRINRKSSDTGFDRFTESELTIETTKLTTKSTMTETGQRVVNSGNSEDAILFGQLQDHMDILEQSGSDIGAYRTIAETAMTIAPGGNLDANVS